jgi:hypothetical protein
MQFVPPRFKELSLSFRAECMHDVSCVIGAILAQHAMDESIFSYGVKSDMFGAVDVVLVFRLYEGYSADEFVATIRRTLGVMSRVDAEDVHVINESINFTDEYDGERTYNGLQRLAARVAVKLASVPFAGA